MTDIDLPSVIVPLVSSELPTLERLRSPASRGFENRLEIPFAYATGNSSLEQTLCLDHVGEGSGVKHSRPYPGRRPPSSQSEWPQWVHWRLAEIVYLGLVDGHKVKFRIASGQPGRYSNTG
jgi:hypothetical protein